MTTKKNQAVLTGGPLDGRVLTYDGDFGRAIQYPTLPPKWTETTYHNTGRVDAKGRLVFEYRGTD